MIAVAKAVCAQDGLFWLACDQAQGLYGHRQENFTGRRFQLLRPYRATRSLTSFCQILAGRGGQGSVGDLPSDSGTGHTSDGEPPLFCQAQNPGASIAYLAERIGRLHDSGLPYSEIMVLYAVGKHQCLEGRQFPLMVKDHLEDKGILCSWPAKDAQSKLAWDITTDTVTISTIYSMKGLDAEAVFILGLDLLDGLDRPQEVIRSLAYAAASRARRHLEIIYSEPSRIIKAMMAACPKHTVFFPS
jgi:hypothetical protein